MSNDRETMTLPDSSIGDWFDPGKANNRHQVAESTAPTQPCDTAPANAGAAAPADGPGPDGARSSCTIQVEGNIFDLSYLRGQLTLPAGTSAADALAGAWRRWKHDSLRRVEGVFAFAMREGDELVLYRDPSGLANLYWCSVRGQVTYAARLATLLQMPGVPRRVARPALHEYLRFLDIAAPSTFFEGMQSVPSGRAMCWSARRVQLLNPDDGHAAAAAGQTRDFAATLTHVDALLKQAVESACDGLQRPAAFLSGGVDSSLICALLARQRGDATAVTVGFDSAAHDETPIAARIAAHLGLRHEVLRFSRADFVGAFERLVQSLDQPMADPATPATVLALEACRGRFDAVLDGTGADEAVGAMPPRHVRVAVQYGALLPRPLRRALVGLMRRVPAVSEYTPILDFEHPADTLIRWHGFTRPEIEALCGEPVSFEHTTFYRTFARFPRHAHYDRCTALLDAMPSDRLSQAMVATGMPMRFPFWDSATQRFLRALPIDFRYRPGQPKRILRELLARYLPRELWDHPKHGFDFPLNDFLRGDDFDLVRRHVVGSGVWQRTGLLEPGLVRDYGERFIAGDDRLTFRVWALVVLGAWLEVHA